MLAVERAADYEYNILSIDFTVAGTAPTVTFSITDPQNNDVPYDLANDPELTASPDPLQRRVEHGGLLQRKQYQR